MLRATGFTFGLPVLVTRSKVAVLLWPPAEAQCSLAQKSLRRPLDPVFGVDSENWGLGGPFTDPGRALVESSVSGAPNLNLAARGHIPWLYKLRIFGISVRSKTGYGS